eukprot:Anaeramoba_flamelloidesc42361_g3_i1.p1 GENE.c42361_g3_i1~~c42361_g3_i1.p1  ORF type:complete len:133 (-),score=32.48 c42361_g3_i1:4-402(-)
MDTETLTELWTFLELAQEYIVNESLEQRKRLINKMILPKLRTPRQIPSQFIPIFCNLVSSTLETYQDRYSRSLIEELLKRLSVYEFNLTELPLIYLPKKKYKKNNKYVKKGNQQAPQYSHLEPKKNKKIKKK